MDGWVSDDEQCNVKLCFERLQDNPGQQGLPADKHFGGCRQATPCMDLAEHPLLADDDEAPLPIIPCTQKFPIDARPVHN